jgi:hypothetical protein
MKKKITSITSAATMPAALLLFVALLFSSCSKNELEDLQFANFPKSTSVADITSDKANNITDVSPNPGIPEDAMIGISHGACMGNCPNYRVTLSTTGEVFYTGIRNVRVLGIVRYSISPEMAHELGYMMVKGGFFNFENQYAIIPDAQRFETSLEWNDKVKVVVDYGINVPAELVTMRKKVEKVLDIDRLINGDASNPAVNVIQ